FLQVPLSVLGVLATKESDWTATEALVIERIPELFTIVGLKVNKII
ncbi:MAG: low-complexity tail membrane protein, partial [Microcystis panniformis]